MCEGLTIDPRTRGVYVDGQLVDLTPIEYRLLTVLAADPYAVVSRKQLHREVWGIEYAYRGRTLDSWAGRLRQKLGATGRRYVITRRGVGYQLLDTRADLPTATPVYAVQRGGSLLLFEQSDQAQEYADRHGLPLSEEVVMGAVTAARLLAEAA